MPTAIRRTARGCFCPICGTIMKRGHEEHDVRVRDAHGRTIRVVRVHYICPFEECNTTVHFDYRTDGEEGDLHKQLAMEKKTGRKLLTDFGGSFGELR